MSKTPKTDEAVQYGYRFTTDLGVDEYVKADFARGLEESETRLRDINTYLRCEGGEMMARMNRDAVALESELIKLRAHLVLAEQIVKEAKSYVSIGWDHSNESEKLMDLIAKWDADRK